MLPLEFYYVSIKTHLSNNGSIVETGVNGTGKIKVNLLFENKWRREPLCFTQKEKYQKVKNTTQNK